MPAGLLLQLLLVAFTSAESWYDSLESGVDAVGSGVADVGDGVVAAGDAVGSGVAAAGGAVGSGVAAVGSAVASAGDVVGAGVVVAKVAGVGAKVYKGAKIVKKVATEAGKVVTKAVTSPAVAEAEAGGVAIGEAAADDISFAADPPSSKNVLISYIKKPDTFPAGNTVVLNLSQAEDLGELYGTSWAFLFHHLHPNYASTNQQQFLVLDQDSFFQLHSLMEARISFSENMNAPPTFLGFQLSFATVGFGLVNLTIVVLWAIGHYCEDDDDGKDAQSCRQGYDRALLAESSPSEHPSSSSGNCLEKGRSHWCPEHAGRSAKNYFLNFFRRSY